MTNPPKVPAREQDGSTNPEGLPDYEHLSQVGIDALGPGDVVRHVGSGDAYVMITRYIAVRQISVTNPQEWVLVSKSLRLDQ